MANISEGILLGCGNPLLDISASVSDDLLEKYGMKTDDAILAEDRHMPLYGELIEKFNADFIAGGSVQNTLRVCQWLLEKPNVAVFFGAVGSDNYAKILEEKARTDGVNVQYQYVDASKAATGTCAVLITGTHRSLCANLSAANHFTIDHLQKPENQRLIENSKFFYISGFFCTVSPPTIKAIASHAAKNNKPFMMNLSAPFISQFCKELLLEILPYVDILFGNETEALAFAKAQNWDSTDLKVIGRRICELQKANEKRKRIVVLTQGQHPVLLFEDNNEIREFEVKRLEPSEVVDTNGAGDAFVGGFLSQYIQGKPLDTCVRCGIWSARKIIQRSGCTFEGTPDFSD